MSLDIGNRDKTELFTVVGAPYVAERHNDSRSHLQVENEKPPPEPGAGIAGLWAVFYAIIAIGWVFGSGTVTKAIEYAVAMLK
jgi:hypothetical protein